MRIIVTGSRRWSSLQAAFPVLQYLFDALEPTAIVQGGAAGVDLAAKIAAFELNLPCETYPANWEELGNKAGPFRNQRMVDAGADLVIGFPAQDSRGTWDCLNRAKKAGIPRVIIHLGVMS